MVKHLIAFGHGEGDTGGVYGSRFESEVVRRLEPYLKKWAKQSIHTFDFFKGNLYKQRKASTIKGYDQVTEIHTDMPKGSGGHVIIKKGFKPDNQDLQLRDLIKRHFGIVRKNTNGIDYRDNLFNLNEFARRGVTYRLLELFFLSNDEDYNHYNRNLDKIAKEMIEALTGENLSGKVSTTTPKKESDKMYKVQTGAFTQKKNAEDLAKRLKKDGYETYVIFEGSTPALNKQKSVKQLYDEVMAGKHGSGETRKKSLGGRYQEVQNYINSRH